MSMPVPDRSTQSIVIDAPPERIMAGDRPRGQRVAVYDCDGYYAAPGIAELLARFDRVAPVPRAAAAARHPIACPSLFHSIRRPARRRP